MPRPTTSVAVLLLASALLASGCTPPGDAADGAVPEEVAGQNVLGTAYLGQQKWTEAGSAFEAALERRPDDPLLLTNLAIALNQHGDVDTAVARLRRALELDPDHPRAHYNLGLIDSRDGRFDEAAAHFEAVARHDPDDLFTQYYLASALARVERTDEAISAYRRALDRDPTHVSSLYGLGRLLLQHGRQDEGAELITRSQAIRARSGLDEAVGSQYGEQGPYAMGAEYAGSALAAPDAIRVRFEPQARVRVRPGSNGVAWTAATMSPDAAVPTVALAQQASVLQLSPPGRQQPLAPPAPDLREIVALEAGDLDRDGRTDLVAWLGDTAGEASTAGGTLLDAALLVQDDAGGFAWRPLSGTRIAARTKVAWRSLATLLVDRDHDGDLDVVWCWTGDGDRACRVATADGALGFELTPGSDHGLSPATDARGPLGLALSDVDSDRDVDLLLHDAGGLTVFSNQRDGSFRALVGDGPRTIGVEGLVAASVVDLDKDGWMDLLLGGDGGVSVARNRRGRFEPPAALAAGAAAVAARAVLPADLDNDGFVDVLVGSAESTTWWRNRGADGWLAEPLQALGAASGPRLAFDGDGDGDLDLLAIGDDGSVALVGNDGGDANGWIAVALTGVGDNRHGIGTKAEVLAGAMRQKFEIARPLPLHAGVGSRELAHSVRLRWPGGVLQDEVRLETRRTHRIEQLDRKGTSCPLLYVQRDGRWRFVTDFLGGAAVGAQLAPGIYNTPDAEEFVLIEPGPTPADDGTLRLRVNNQLQEVIWFDRLRLLAVDHPEGSEVFPDERLMPGPPYPPFRLFASGDVRPLRRAVAVGSGTDVTDRLAELDRRYVAGFTPLPHKGYARPHTLELDLGPVDTDRRVVLLLDGWIDYADSSANVAATQAGHSPMPPRLEVADGGGGWRSIDGSIGFPAGLPKTMTVELTGLLTPRDPRIRIVTSMRLHWDRARVMVGGDDLDLQVRHLDALDAELRFGGFPRERRPTAGGPPVYDPDAVDTMAPWRAHRGHYTPFGEVGPLVAARDDRFVTTRNGDEIELRFPQPEPPASGMRRSWLLHAVGFGKDMDPNSAANDALEPIPFHDMPQYPYGPEIAPPVAQDHAGRPPRVVAPSTAPGTHGATPQPLLDPALFREGLDDR